MWFAVFLNVIQHECLFNLILFGYQNKSCISVVLKYLFFTSWWQQLCENHSNRNEDLNALGLLQVVDLAESLD
jgi:hypothetical protein